MSGSKKRKFAWNEGQMLDLEQKKISRKEALNDDHILSHAPLPFPPPALPLPFISFSQESWNL